MFILYPTFPTAANSTQSFNWRSRSGQAATSQTLASRLHQIQAAAMCAHELTTVLAQPSPNGVGAPRAARACA